MAIDYADNPYSLTRDQVRKAFKVTHAMYLTLNDEIARSGSCFRQNLPAWRKQRDAWARFYSSGWGARRYEDMQHYRLALFRWRTLFMFACGRTEASLPLYAAR